VAKGAPSQDQTAPVVDTVVVTDEERKKLLLQEAQQKLPQALRVPFESATQHAFEVDATQGGDIMRQVLRNLTGGRVFRSTERYGEDYFKEAFVKFFVDIFGALEKTKDRQDFAPQIYQTVFQSFADNQWSESISHREFVMEHRNVREALVPISRNFVPSQAGDRAERILGGYNGSRVNVESRTKPAYRDIITQGLTIRKTPLDNLYFITQQGFRGYAIATNTDATHGNIDVLVKEKSSTSYYRSVGP